MRRSREQIVYEILKICRNGVNKTTIVYKANTNFESVKSYLQDLIENHLIYANQGIYQTTPHGISLLESINQVSVQLSGYDTTKPVVVEK
jgi:predicted transcriptional regulator